MIDATDVSAWGYGGQTMGRGPAPVDAWKKQTALAEHEYPKARILYALPSEVLAAQNIPVQGRGREAYHS